MKKSELKQIIKEEIEKTLIEGLLPKIGQSDIRGVLIAKSIDEVPGKYYVDFDNVNNFFIGKDTIASDRTNPDDEGRWVNNKDYKWVTLILK